MRKMPSILFLCCIAITLCACAPIQGGRILFDDSHSIVDARVEKLIEAINDRDTEAIKALFSGQTLNEVLDFDESIERLFEFIPGEIVSWESTGSYSSQTSNHYGHKTKEVSSSYYFYVDADKEEYVILLNDFFVDTDNPDRVGFYLLIATRSDGWERIADGDQKILFDGDKKLSPKGILVPFE